jgi:hypothetical protein
MRFEPLRTVLEHRPIGFLKNVELDFDGTPM